jgi:hypothetical protein
MSEKISEAFAAIVNYGLAHGVRNLKEHPGLWEAQIDEHWWIAVNPHLKPLDSSHGPKVEFGHCYVEFNGWPAGFITPYGGVIADGAVANEAAFIAALKANTPPAQKLEAVSA